MHGVHIHMYLLVFITSFLDTFKKIFCTPLTPSTITLAKCLKLSRLLNDELLCVYGQMFDVYTCPVDY